MRPRSSIMSACLFGASVILLGCADAPEPPERSQPPAPAPAPPREAATTASITAGVGRAPTASQAILAWDGGETERAIEMLLEAVESGDAELHILPRVSEAEFAQLSEASRNAVMPRIIQMDRAWTQLAREMLVRASRLERDGDADQARRLFDAVREVALTNSGKDVVRIYQKRNQSLLSRL